MKWKRYICGLFCTIFLINSPIEAFASNVVDVMLPVIDSEEFIEDYFEAINQHDWEYVSEYYDAETAPRIKAFLTNSVNQERHSGLLNVESVELVEVVDVEYEDAEYLLLNDYEGKVVSTFVVGADYVTYEDTEFYANGICYEIYSVVYEEDAWKIAEKRTIWDFGGLLDAGYEFGTEYHNTEQVIEARKQGVILNYNGDYVSGDAVYAGSLGEMMSTRASSVTAYPVPTEATEITYLDETCYITQGFHTMCKAITYAEVGSDETFGDYPEARKACILAIKTYVWHFYIVQSSKDETFHITYEQIAYNANYLSRYGFLSDYSSVYNVWMQGTSSTGSPIVFEANFKRGYDAAQDAHYHGGDLKQLGCIYLLKNDPSISTYQDLLHYYYDYSNRSQGGPVQFFDYNKNWLY